MADDTEIERMITTFRGAMAGAANEAFLLAGLADVVAQKKAKLRAMTLAREALAIAGDDPRTQVKARGLLQRLMPGYTTPMMNDARRNRAWDAALRRAIRPGMQVLEIGTGAGMLAMMAARAGADRVFTCEIDPVSAACAREVTAHNGFGDRIKVIAKGIADVRLGEDLERPADLLFCDIFGDGLFDFDPLHLIGNACRLLRPRATVIPARVVLKVALAHNADYHGQHELASACGFDLSPMAGLATFRCNVPIHSTRVELLSEPAELFRFDLMQAPLALQGQGEAICTANKSGEINGLLRWIQLELDDETVLEAKPEPHGQFFSRMIFQALPPPRPLQAGQRLRVSGTYNHKESLTWLAGPA